MDCRPGVKRREELASMKQLSAQFKAVPSSRSENTGSSLTPRKAMATSNSDVQSRTCPHCRKVFAKAFSISKHVEVSTIVHFKRHTTSTSVQNMFTKC